jgi:hypothetical protein
MPTKKRSIPVPAPEDACFAKELAGENPPTFAAMQQLYELATELFVLLPWQVLDEDELIVVRDGVTGEFRYCSVMGALGEVFAMHAYAGAEGLSVFREIQSRDSDDPSEFFVRMNSLYVDFVPRAELDRPDRDLLNALGHPRGSKAMAPMFRCIRPGCHAWFVTAEEARTLADCIRAVVVVCQAVVEGDSGSFWDEPDSYPLVTCQDENGETFQIDRIKPVLPPEPPVAAVSLGEDVLRGLRGQDSAVGGVMELDCIYGGPPIGKKNERKTCSLVALALDAQTAMILGMEAADANGAPGEAMAMAFLKALEAIRTLPLEVRVRSAKHQASLAPLMESFGVKLSVAQRLPAFEAARTHFMEFMSRGK